MNMNNKEAITFDWLKRYTGTDPSVYGDWILLTNFQNYVEKFAIKFDLEINGIGGPMTSAINRDGLRDDMNCQTFIPFSSSYAKQGFFKHAPFWEHARVDHLPKHEVPFVSKVNELVKASPRFYKQHANYQVPAHKDIDTLCCVNILITKDKNKEDNQAS